MKSRVRDSWHKYSLAWEGRREDHASMGEKKLVRPGGLISLELGLWQFGSTVVAQQAGWVLNCVALSPEQSLAVRSPAAEPLRYLEQSPHLIVGWPKYFPPRWAPCQYPCKLESCEKCQGKQAWNYSFHLAWKTNLPSVKPILLVKEAQGEENTAVRQPLTAEHLYQAGGLCVVWAADKTQETHSCHTAGSSL